MTDKWLDSWCTARRAFEAKPLVYGEPPKVLPIEHSRYILAHGKKAYREWVAEGCLVSNGHQGGAA